jgi:hypothetical protein
MYGNAAGLFIAHSMAVRHFGALQDSASSLKTGSG